MGCCGSKDVPVVIRNDQGSTSPVRSKKCRDVIFLLLFIAALGGIGFIAFLGFKSGDPGRFIHGVDSWGNVCGRKKNVAIDMFGKKDKNNSFISLIENNTNYDMDRSNNTFEMNLLLSDLSLLLNPSRIISDEPPIILCVTKCPDDQVIGCSDLLTDNGYQLEQDIVDRRVCQMPGKNIFAHQTLMNRCVPKQLASLGKNIAQASIATVGVVATAGLTNSTGMEPSQPKSAMQHAHDIILSVTDNWQAIVYLLLIAVVISLLTIILLQLFTRVLVITIMIVSAFGTAAGSAYLWYHYLVSIGVVSRDVVSDAIANLTLTPELIGIQENATDDFVNSTTDLPNSIFVDDLEESEYLLPITIIATIFTLLSWIILIWTRKSLKLVINLFDEASLALFSMPAIVFQPFLTVIALSLSFAAFLVISAFLLSDQELRMDEDGIVTFVDRPGWRSGKVLFIPVVFVFLWVFEFIFACQEIILAGAITSWFFARGKEKSKCSCKVCPTLKPTKDLILYNLGSAALGSLIIAIVQFIRLVLAYVQKKLKKSGNKTAQYVLKCIQCCLTCFEKVLKYINRNAYICIAMYGDSFCSSAKKALALLVSNAQHVMTLNCISGFCLLLGKVTVVAVVGSLASAWFGANTASNLMFLVPMILCCLGAYLIASCFMSVFAMAIDTIFLCFCDDHQRNDGNERPYYSSKSLQKFMESTNKEKTKVEQPTGSAGATSPTSRRIDRTRIHKRVNSDPPSFTRINIKARENTRKSHPSRDNKIYPLPGSAMP